MNGIIAYKLIDGKYELYGSGVGLIIENEVDKVLPVRDYVAKQAEKLIYDGEKLSLKDGEVLLSKKELDEQQNDNDAEKLMYIDDEERDVVEVEM